MMIKKTVHMQLMIGALFQKQMDMEILKKMNI